MDESGATERWTTVEGEAVQLLLIVQSLAKQVEAHTAESRKSYSFYVRSRRVGREFLREARHRQSLATKTSLQLDSHRATIRRLYQAAGMGLGERPSAAQRRLIQDLRQAEKLIAMWGSPPETTE